MTDTSDDDNLIVLDAIRKAREMEALRAAMFGHPSTRHPLPRWRGQSPVAGGLPETEPTTEQEDQ